MREEIEEKDHHIQEQNATISAMKERTLNEIQFMKGEIEKTLLQNQSYERRNHKPKGMQDTTDTKRHPRPPKNKEVTASPQRKQPMVTNNQRTEQTVVLPKRKKTK